MTIDAARERARLLWCHDPAALLRPCVWIAYGLRCVGYLDADLTRTRMGVGETWENAFAYAQARTACAEQTPGITE